MSIVTTSYKTITCNGPRCTNTITFEDSQGAAQKVAAEVPWFKTLRVVQVVVTGRNLTLCSDQCELDSVASGAHNPEERTNIILPHGANSQEIAAAQAKQAEEATKAMKKGSGLSLV